MIVCGARVVQDGLDDCDGAIVGDRALLAGSEEIADRFLDFWAGVTGQLGEDVSGGAGVACIG